MIEQPYLVHAPVEPMNCLVHPHAVRCEIWNGEQWHTMDQALGEGARPQARTGHDQSVICGRRLGRRANPHRDYLREAVRIARAARAQGVDAPVKLVWMREDDRGAGYYRPVTVHRVRLAVDSAGNRVSWSQALMGQSFFPPGASGVDAEPVEGAADTPYGIQNFKVTKHIAKLPVQTQWMRSVGHTHAAFVGETLMDEAVRAVDKDP